MIAAPSARSNASGRYEHETRVLVDDGWTKEDEAPPPLKTKVLRDSSLTIIPRNASPDISFDRLINPYKGCEHGCVYCFARPKQRHLGLSLVTAAEAPAASSAPPLQL